MVVPILRVRKSLEVGEIRKSLRAFRPEAVIGGCDAFLEAAGEGLRRPEDFGKVSLNVNEDNSDACSVTRRQDVICASAGYVSNSYMQRNFEGLGGVSSGTHIDGIWRKNRTLPPVEELKKC